MDDHGPASGPVTSARMAPDPRVRCGDCSFAWFGASAAHGLRIVGSCPRCGGELEFLGDEEQDAADVAMADRSASAVAPASVLGTPMSWDR